MKTLPYDRARALISLPMLFENVTRWHNAAGTSARHPARSISKHSIRLLPDGSITWSNQHMDLFTPERTRKLNRIAFAEQRENDPPQVDPKGVDAFDKLLDFLKRQGRQVYLVKPPFNPIYL